MHKLPLVVVVITSYIHKQQFAGVLGVLGQANNRQTIFSYTVGELVVMCLIFSRFL